MKQQVVTVEIVLSEAERLAEGITRWSVKRGNRRVTIGHWHCRKDRDFRVDSAWYYVEGEAGADFVHKRDFGTALAVARKMLGVRS